MTISFSISFLDFFCRLCFGSFAVEDRFRDFFAGCWGVGGPGAGGGGMGAWMGAGKGVCAVNGV